MIYWNKKFPKFSFCCYNFPNSMGSIWPQSQTIDIKYKAFANTSAFICNNLSFTIFTKNLGPKGIMNKQHSTFNRFEGTYVFCKTWKPYCCLRLLGQRQHLGYIVWQIVFCPRIWSRNVSIVTLLIFFLKHNADFIV